MLLGMHAVESQRMNAFSGKVSNLPPGEKGVIADFLKGDVDIYRKLKC
jgi:hypothetical protein